MSVSILGNIGGEYPGGTSNGERPVAEVVCELCAYSIQVRCLFIYFMRRGY